MHAGWVGRRARTETLLGAAARCGAAQLYVAGTRGAGVGLKAAWTSRQSRGVVSGRLQHLYRASSLPEGHARAAFSPEQGRTGRGAPANFVFFLALRPSVSALSRSVMRRAGPHLVLPTCTAFIFGLSVLHAACARVIWGAASDSPMFTVLHASFCACSEHCAMLLECREF